MEPTSPDRATPEQTVETAAATPAPSPPPVGARSARTLRLETRLRKKAGVLEMVAWARGWVSRATRMHRLLAARTLDFAVLTDDGLTLVSTGFFSRRPRRRVYWAELQELNVVDDPVAKGRRLRVQSPDAPELWIELGQDARSMAFADALVACTRREPA